MTLAITPNQLVFAVIRGMKAINFNHAIYLLAHWELERSAFSAYRKPKRGALCQYMPVALCVGRPEVMVA